MRNTTLTIIEKSNFLYECSWYGINDIDHPCFSKIYGLIHSSGVCTKPDGIADCSITTYPSHLVRKWCRNFFLAYPFPFFALVIGQVNFPVSMVGIAHSDAMILVFEIDK